MLNTGIEVKDGQLRTTDLSGTPWYNRRYIRYDGQALALQAAQDRVTWWGSLLLAGFFLVVTYFVLLGG